MSFSPFPQAGHFQIKVDSVSPQGPSWARVLQSSTSSGPHWSLWSDPPVRDLKQASAKCTLWAKSDPPPVYVFAHHQATKGITLLNG